MKKFLLALSVLLCLFTSNGQQAKQNFERHLAQQIDSAIVNDYQSVAAYFEEAYLLYPDIPRGMLEAVAYNYTRFTHLTPEETDTSNYMPATYGVMGLTLNGRGYFRDNLHYVSQLSGISEERIMRSPRDNILAYASAYSALQREMGIVSGSLEEQIPILNALSELPASDRASTDFAVQSNLYSIFRFFDETSFRERMHISTPPLDYEHCFGTMLPYLQAPNVMVTEEGKISLFEDIERQKDIEDIAQMEESVQHPLSFKQAEIAGSTENSRDANTDYPSARWVAAASCNYSSRNGHQVSAVTIHYTQGTYAGAISWFQNCSSSVSAHYVLRSSDGQVTQMVREADKAWHVGSANSYTVGLEHEAYGNIYSYFTPAMYASSADLTRNICDRNGINPLRMFYRDTLDDGTVLNNGLHDLGGETACTKIRGHQHYPNQSHTDPGRYWNWNYYFKLVNDDTPVTRYTTVNGRLTDSGGENGDYGNDERQLFLIEIPGAEGITLDFTGFDLEDNYDFMWIYNGNSVFSPLIGRWNTHSPGTVTTTRDALMIEFRSDCATTAPGWVAEWHANVPIRDSLPITEIILDESEWFTDDFQVDFRDHDDQGLLYQFYQVMGNTGIRWTANSQQGFFCDNFDDLNGNLWTIHSGQWGEDNNQLRQTDMGTAVLSAPLNANLSDVYLYDFFAQLENNSGNAPDFEIRIHQSQTQPNLHDNSYGIVVSPQQSMLTIMKYQNGAGEVLAAAECATETQTNGYYRIIHDQQNGTIHLFRNGTLLLTAHDAHPLASPGNGFSFITHDQAVVVDNLRVYRSRGQSVNIAVGSGLNCEGCYRASHGNARTKIKSVVVDQGLQFSSLQEKMVKIDDSAPQLSGRVNDGQARDVDTWESTTFSANWPVATDAHSDIQRYDYEIYDRDALSTMDFQNRWKGSTTTNSLTAVFPFLRGHRYVVKVRALNHAGLFSSYIFSDGFTYYPATNTKTRNLVVATAPNPVEEEVSIFLTEVQPIEEENSPSMWEAEEYHIVLRVYDMYGKLMMERMIMEPITTIRVQDWAAGVYVFQLYDEHDVIECKKVVKR